MVTESNFNEGNLDDDGQPVLNPVNPDAEAIPEDIENFLAELGIQEKKYTCTVKRAPTSGGLPEHLPGSHLGGYPDINDIGKKFGPGKYFFSFKYHVPLPNGGRKQTCKDFPVVLGDAWQDICDEYHAEKYLKDESKLNTLRQKARIKRALTGTDNAPSDGVENLLKSTEILRNLGVPMGNQNLPVTTDNNAMGQIIGLIMTMQQQATQMQLEMMKGTNQNMVTLMTALIGKGDNKNQFKEALDFMKDIMDAKQILSPQKEDTIDKVFKLLEGVLPMLGRIAHLKASERARIAKPLVEKARESKEYQEIAGDNDMLKALCERMDAVHGPENTETILETMGWARPPESPLEQAQDEVEKEIKKGDGGDRPD